MYFPKSIHISAWNFWCAYVSCAFHVYVYPINGHNAIKETHRSSDLHTHRRRQACLIQIQWTCNCLFCLPAIKTAPLCVVIVVYHRDPTLNLQMTMSIIHIIRPMLKLCIIKYVILHQKGSPHFLCSKKCKMNAKFFS